MDYISYYDSPSGKLALGSDGTSLIGLWFDNQRYFASVLEDEYIEKDLPVFEDTRRWLDIYFAGQDPGFLPEISLRGTVFQKQVWNILLKIPYGETITYGQIAEMIAEQRNIRRMSAQAVGSAVGHNPVSIIVPCHRVIGSNGSLIGYAAGIDIKKKLLEMEGIQL